MASVVALTELLTINSGGSPVTPDNPLPVSPINVQTELRETFETYTPGVVWSQVQGSGDIIQLDGNAVASSYLVISKDPLTAGTESSITTIATFDCPSEMVSGLSMSQRVLGQEMAMELISTDTPISPVADVAIASISQATTTLTITTSTAHNLSAGSRFGVYGITSDSRFNYPALVVASVTSSTVFTATAGPGGTIPSVTAGPYTSQGYVYYRPSLGYAQEGVSEIFENATVTNASFYVRSDSGDALPSGTLNGSHSVTVGTTASVQAINSPYTYAFQPTNEFRFLLTPDRVQAYDVNVDTINTNNARLQRSQIVPSNSKKYKLRYRFTNDKALTVPSAKIVSAAKSASATATITTADAHGLTTGDYVVIYGIRDTTNFAALTTPTVVASVINSTQFTVVMALSTTATSYGGMVARAQGANVPTGFNQGTNGSVITAQGFSGELQLTASNTYTFLIGDYVNVYGVRDNTTGADLGVDGVYKVIDVSASTARLSPIGSTPTPSTFGSTACGGLIIKRTDVRISFARLFHYLRERVEILPKPATDQQASMSVYMTGGTLGSGTMTANTQAANTYSLQSSTNLASSATFTGTAQNIASATTSLTVYNTQLVIGVTHTAGLVPGQLYLDLGTETSSTAPTVWYQALAVPIPSNANWQQFAVPISTRYYRLRFVNGATAQTNFRLSSYLTYNGGGLSGQMAFPSNLQIPLSTTNLAISGVFTSATLDFGDTMSVYQSLNAVVFADQVSASNGLQIQVSRDGTNWRVAAQATVTASTYTTLNASLFLRYARVVYTNGGVAQTSFALDVQAESQ